MLDALYISAVGLQAQKEQLAALIEAMPGYVLWTDLDGHTGGALLTWALRLLPPSHPRSGSY